MTRANLNIVKFEDAQVNTVYVTQGGLITDTQGVQFPWGYERLRLIRKDTKNQFYVFTTPWNTQIEIKGDYIIYMTPEDHIFSEHKMIGIYESVSIEYIPFNEAVKKEICSLQISQEIPDEDEPVNIRQAIINYFIIPRKIGDAAKHFSIPYPHIRNHLKMIEKNGFNGIKYKMIENLADDGRKIVQFMQVG
jgi:hypothetical protein